ncbi:hypothetical protein F5Y07DRAFT_394133 [Xylaria sp. FL0933]|nr:hypothetical protein F5Y07DRAFT_394133 [Xylaria sp. FL0933]
MSNHSPQPPRAIHQANRPMPGPNPYLWVPSAELQKQIQELVYHELFSDTNVGKDDVRNRISYRLASISFDENLKPHLVFPAFWTHDTLRTPLISVRPAEGTPSDWDRCYRELLKQVLEPRGLHVASVLLTNGDSSQFHGPRAILMEGQTIRMGSSPDIQRLLETRRAMLQARSPYPMAPDQLYFLHYLLPLLTGLLQNGVISRSGIQDYLHRS